MREYLLFCRPLLSTRPVVTVAMIEREALSFDKDGPMEYFYHFSVAIKHGNDELLDFIEEENQRRQDGEIMNIKRKLVVDWLHYALCDRTMFNRSNLNQNGLELCDQFWHEMKMTGRTKHFNEKSNFLQFLYFKSSFRPLSYIQSFGPYYIHNQSKLVILSRNSICANARNIATCLGLSKNYLYFHPILLQYEKELNKVFFAFHETRFKKQQQTLEKILQEMEEFYHTCPNPATHRSHAVLIIIMQYLKERFKTKVVKLQSKINAFLYDQRQADRMLNLKGISSSLIFPPLRELESKEEIGIFTKGPNIRTEIELNCWIWNLSEYCEHFPNPSDFGPDKAFLI